ncbi:cytochrome P450 CYP82D47-like isoform X2 [Durio zibethinus]|uniref:Cytochrome P450 CYP82D47-like isoform X2 n=1 Tax=Durio zibethinus TaxID=66656 RepID=A0A6P6ANP7_DURZI|nr:cytochrome P450 CYP82D47-like isoform X2 [Durio zibethinus]
MDLLGSQLSTFMAGLATVLLLFFYLVRCSRVTESKKMAPQAAGAWPIIGHLRLLGGPQLPHITLGALAEKYGPVYSIWIGIHPGLVVSNWEIAKEIFTNYDVAVTNRPGTIAAEHLGFNYAMAGVAPYGSYWREMRKIINTALLSNRRLEILKHVRVSEAEVSIKELYKTWSEENNGSGHVLVEMKQWFGDLTLNVILRMVAGKRYFGSGAKGEDKKARRCQKAMREWFHLLGVFALKDAVPSLGFLDLGGHEKAMKETAKELDSIASEWLEEHKQKRASGEAKEQDFMDVLLSLLDGTNLATEFGVDTINKANCLSMITGGSDTPKVTLTWTLSLLLNNLHWLRKVQDELDIHVGKQRLVNESDLSKLEYLQAVVKETLRLHPPVLLYPRLCSDEIVVSGYHVPRGCWIFLNLFKIQTDPGVWSDPLEFKPERFLTTHKDFDVGGDQYFELIPFGFGRRVCPGMSFGLQMVHLTLASLLQAFDISTPANATVDMSEEAGLSNMKATPLEVLVKPRLPSKIYE